MVKSNRKALLVAAAVLATGCVALSSAAIVMAPSMSADAAALHDLEVKLRRLKL